MLKRLIAITLVVYLVSGAALAQPEPRVLSLEEAIGIAVAHNPKFKAAQTRLDVSNARILTAGAVPNPFLTTSNSFAEETHSFGLRQTFELGGKRRKRIELAETERDIVQAGVQEALLDLKTDVRDAYTTLFVAQERLAAAEEVVKIAEQLLLVARKREQAGDIAMLDVMQVQIPLLEAKNDRENLAADTTAARNRLNTLLHYPLDASYTLVSPTDTGEGLPFTEEALESLIAEALEQRPEVQQVRESIESSERRLALARANRIPDLNINAGPQWVTEEDTRFNAFVSGMLEIPLFNRQQGPILEARALKRRYEQELTAMENTVALEVSNAYASLRSNHERLQRYENELLPTAQRIMEKSRQSFEEGKSPVVISLNAQQAYTNTRLGYLEAVLDYQSAVNDLERAIGAGL